MEQIRTGSLYFLLLIQTITTFTFTLQAQVKSLDPTSQQHVSHNFMEKKESGMNLENTK
jgi:hypothetical protein